MDEHSPENTPEPVAMSRSQYVWTLVAIAAVGIGLAWFRGEQAAAPSGEGTVASEPKVAGNGGEAERLVLEFPMMGTRAAVAFYGDREEAENAAKAVRETFLRIQGICNLFDPASELSRLNATAAEKPLSLRANRCQKSRRTAVNTGSARQREALHTRIWALSLLRRVCPAPTPTASYA